jgi:UDP-N-acetylmuramoylalanine--D-glutamate ligase
LTAHSYPSGSIFSSLADIKDKRITVMGIGLNGGGEEAVRFFLRNGAAVTACDTKGEKELAPVLERLRGEFPGECKSGQMTFVVGQPHRLEDFENADAVIKNPGIKYEGNKFLAAAKVVETDFSVFLSLLATKKHENNTKIIAVTGTKGKSSTVQGIYNGLRAAGKNVFLAGNIGVSPLTFFAPPSPPPLAGGAGGGSQ